MQGRAFTSRDWGRFMQFLPERQGRGKHKQRPLVQDVELVELGDPLVNTNKEK